MAAIFRTGLAVHQTKRVDEDITLDGARRLAAQCDSRWTEVYLNKKSRLVSFVRDDDRINVCYTTGTVGTVLSHPEHGRTQLFRTKVDMNMLSQLFGNPRMHTQCVYYDTKGKARVYERLVSEDGSPVTDDVVTALRTQVASIDQEIENLKLHRAALVETIEDTRRKRKEEERERARKALEETMRLVAASAKIKWSSKEAGKQLLIDEERIDRRRELTFCMNQNLHDFLESIDLREASRIVAHPEYEMFTDFVLHPVVRNEYDFLESASA